MGNKVQVQLFVLVFIFVQEISGELVIRLVGKYCYFCSRLVGNYFYSYVLDMIRERYDIP